MREVFAPQEPSDPGRVYYTICQEDIGKVIIRTEIGPIPLTDVMGRVTKKDVGKRLYRVPTSEPSHWIWQIENRQQYETRTRKE